MVSNCCHIAPYHTRSSMECKISSLCLRLHSLSISDSIKNITYQESDVKRHACGLLRHNICTLSPSHGAYASNTSAIPHPVLPSKSPVKSPRTELPPLRLRTVTKADLPPPVKRPPSRYFPRTYLRNSPVQSHPRNSRPRLQVSALALWQ